MTEVLDDLPFDYGAAEANPAAPQPKCRRHDWRLYAVDGSITAHGFDAEYRCARCDKPRDEARARVGRNNRKRGNAEELTVARKVGGRKMGPLGLPWDVEIEGYMRLQVKKLAKWPSVAQVAVWLDIMPVGPSMRGVALVEAAGQGVRGRRLLVLDLDEFARWHGDPTKGEAA